MRVKREKKAPGWSPEEHQHFRSQSEKGNEVKVTKKECLKEQGENQGNENRLFSGGSASFIH